MGSPADKAPVPGSAPVQGPLWSARTKDWAEFQEPSARPLFEAILKSTSTGPGVTMLDVGCGAGLFCQMAAGLGARVSGVDAAEKMIAMARSRTPAGDFRVGDMEQLPFADNSFDLVTGVNSFLYAANPLRALQEAHRVTKPRALLVVAARGRSEDCDTTALLAALDALSPPAPPDAPGPLAFSGRASIETLVRQAGFEPKSSLEVEIRFDYANLESALRGMLSTGPAVKAIQASGEEKVSAAVAGVLSRFQQPAGGYLLKNRYLFVLASRAQANYLRPGFRTLTPYLVVDDAPRLMEFLQAAFGAHELLRVPNPDGTVMHAEMQIADSRLELAQGNGRWKASPAAIHLYVPDADATYQRALDAGATTLNPPHDAPYGDRAADILDPCGNYWFIATHKG